MLLSSLPDQPVIGRLYDMNGVLLGESLAVDLGMRDRTPGPTGLVSQERLLVGGLMAGGTYLLQIVPTFDVGPAGTSPSLIGVSGFKQCPEPGTPC